MDKRIVFFIIFSFTALCTGLVFAVSLLTNQSWMNTALFSLATMWISGIISQLLFHNLYLGMVRPLEEEKEELLKSKSKVELDIEDVEVIEDVKAFEESRKAILEGQGIEPMDKPAAQMGAPEELQEEAPSRGLETIDQEQKV